MALSSPGARRAMRRSPSPEDRVIVVHGLWLHGAVMARFCARMHESGFSTHTFSYPSMRRSAPDNAAALSRFIAGLPGHRLHIVAHSLGGLISLLYAQDRPDPRLRSVVLLGSPIAGSAVARRLDATRIGRAFLGHARSILISGVTPSLPKHLRIGVVAGSRGIGLGRWVMPLEGEHDGTVRVEETRVPEATDSITLPVTHTGMMFSARVARAVAEFLIHGKFVHATP